MEVSSLSYSSSSSLLQTSLIAKNGPLIYPHLGASLPIASTTWRNIMKEDIGMENINTEKNARHHYSPGICTPKAQ